MDRRFDARTRTAEFDQLWSALDASYWDGDFVHHLDQTGARQAARQRVAHASTRREFLIEIVRMLALLNDPHAQGDNLTAYWHALTGQSCAAVYSWMYRAAGRYWVAFPRSALVLENSVAPGLQPDRPYELLTVEGIPACVASIGLLEAPWGMPVNVQVRDVDGCERDLVLVTPLPPVTQSYADGRPRLNPPALPQSGPIGYARIPGFERQTLAEAFDRDLNPLLRTDSLVLDLRGNGGGKFTVLANTLGRFLDRPRRLADLEIRVSWLALFGAADAHMILPLVSFPRSPTYDRPVVVIIDGTTGSSAEIAALALHDLVGATLVGEPTIGAGAGVQIVTLADGLKVRFGSQLIRNRDGNPFQGVGVQPDIRVDLDPEDLRLRGRRAFSEWRARVYYVALHTAEAYGKP